MSETAIHTEAQPPLVPDSECSAFFLMVKRMAEEPECDLPPLLARLQAVEDAVADNIEVGANP